MRSSVISLRVWLRLEQGAKHWLSTLHARAPLRASLHACVNATFAWWPVFIIENLAVQRQIGKRGAHAKENDEPPLVF